ncbi:longitudinals lacking protein, isoforms F/I/K/T-like isoform X4 [Homarus americanus]|uniref:longitudinals lacking protein, isoforms F/I/K/T-like isoform X4 n=1 Tax=Homarus americanus TaxID=6706 RepID=UPI001C43E7EC|nr:longitudinals lacking protein, isoforms F/I/K/T-like isoform X4 [Homarus americanus]
MEELLSLKWNNHRSTFLHILGVLRDKQAYTDVTLACDGKFYSVHKLVLSTCSDYFCAMFDKTACKSPVIVLKDIKSEDLEALLDYMYLGEVNVRQCDLASLIKAAENLRIKGLAVPDDEPLKKGAVTTPSRAEPTRRDGGSGSPPSKRKRRDEGEDGREDVRPPPPLQSGLHTPPPPPRPKSPVSQRLSPSPLRTSQESLVTEDRDSRPLSSPAESPVTSHVPSHQSSQQLTHQPSQPPLQSSQPLPEQQQTSNQYRGEDTPTFVKVEMEEEDTGDIHQDSYNLSGDGYKEEEGGDLGGDLSNDLPEFLQQAASGALAGTSASYHHAFAGPSGFQPEVSGWQGDSQSLPGSFAGLGFQPSTQDNPPGEECVGGSSVCGICGKLFQGSNHKFLLRRHILTHTGERRHACPYCSYQGNQAGNLNRHIRNLHPAQAHGHEGIMPQQVARSSLPVIPGSRSSHQSILTSRPTVQLPVSPRSILQQLPLSPRHNPRPSETAPRSPSPCRGSSRPSLTTPHHHFSRLPLHLPSPATVSSVSSTSVNSSTSSTTTSTTATTVCPD